MTKLVILLLFYWDKCTHFNGMSAIVCGLRAAMCQCGKARRDRWLLRLFEYVFWCWIWHETDWLLHRTFAVKICRKVHSYLVNLAVVASWMGNVKLTLFRGHQVSASISVFFRCHFFSDCPGQTSLLFRKTSTLTCPAGPKETWAFLTRPGWILCRLARYLSQSGSSIFSALIASENNVLFRSRNRWKCGKVFLSV